MSKLVFRNRNTKAIKKILMEIGHKAYAEALEEQGLNRQPPISMSGFYIEYNVKTKEEDIWYTYPSGVSFKIISLLGYFTPKEGWEKVWEL